MKDLFISMAAVALFTASSCSKDKIHGEGAVATQDRSVGMFTRVVTNGSTRVQITQGANITVQVKGYANLLPYLETKVDNGTLRVGFKSGVNVSNDNTEMIVTMPSLQGVRSNGSADLTASGSFQAADVEAVVNGSGNIQLRQIATQLLRTQINGSGSIRAFDATAQRVETRTAGSGDTEVRAEQSLKANLSGSGSVYYKGNPGQIETSITGSGKVVYRP